MANIFKKIKAEWGRIEKKTKAEVARYPSNLSKWGPKVASLAAFVPVVGPALSAGIAGHTMVFGEGGLIFPYEGGNVLTIDPNVQWGGTQMGQGTFGQGPFGLPVGGLPDPGVYTPPTAPEINPIMIGFAALLLIMLFGEGK